MHLNKQGKVPIAEWLALKLAADEHGGVGVGRRYQTKTTQVLSYTSQPDNRDIEPVCLLGIAEEAGILPLPDDEREFMWHQQRLYGMTYHRFDAAAYKCGAKGAGETRAPFEQFMAELGLEPAAR